MFRDFYHRQCRKQMRRLCPFSTGAAGRTGKRCVRRVKMLSFSLWAFLPPIFSAFTAAGLWLVYYIAVSEGRIVSLSSTAWRTNGSFYPPYISVAGNFPPASCIFSEVMNLSAFLGFLMAVLRFLQLKPRMNRTCLNVGSLVLFSLGCFGMTLVGNFQVFTDVVTHNIGTFMTFGLGILFCWMQSFITLRVNIKNEGRKVAAVRFLLSGIITFCFILHTCLAASMLHMHAARSQWALVMFFLIFLSTFAIEFRHSSFGVVCTDASAGRPGSVSEPFSDMCRYPPEQL